MVFYSDRARINADDPRRTAACERCCGIFNLEDLSPQYRWAGMQLVNTNVYVCARCLDVPAPFERAIILPPDPPPVFLTRLVNFPGDAVSLDYVRDPVILGAFVNGPDGSRVYYGEVQ
jgi:hypothetical protein